MAIAATVAAVAAAAATTGYSSEGGRWPKDETYTWYAWNGSVRTRHCLRMTTTAGVRRSRPSLAGILSRSAGPGSPVGDARGGTRRVAGCRTLKVAGMCTGGEMQRPDGRELGSVAIVSRSVRRKSKRRSARHRVADYSCFLSCLQSPDNAFICSVGCSVVRS